MRTTISILAILFFSSFAVGQQNNLLAPRSQQTHGRARSAPDVASLPGFDEDNRVGVSDQLLDGEKIFVNHDGIFWYDAADPTTPNTNRIDGGTFAGNFVREFLGKIHNVTTTQRTNAELISFPGGQSALIWDSTEAKLYRADGNGFLVNPTFTEIVSGGGGSPLAVEDESILIDADTVVMDFVGTGVTTTQTAAGEVQVTIPGETPLVAEDEGTPIETATANIDFVGAGVTATNTGAGSIQVTIPGGGGSFDDFSLAGDTGTPEVIADGNTMLVAGGEGIDTIVSATDTLTVDLAINTLGATPGLTGNETIAIYNPTTLNHESILITSLPGSTDTNFALDSLTFDDNQTHDLATNDVEIVNGAVVHFRIEGLGDTALIGSAGSNFFADEFGLRLNIGTNNDLEVDGDPGVLGEVLQSNGNGQPPTWEVVGFEAVDEAAPVEAVVKKVNWKGAGVDVTSVATGEIDVTIPGGGGAALSIEDEGTEIEAATAVIDATGQAITATSTVAGEVDLFVGQKLVYGENLTAGDPIQINASGEAILLANVGTEQIDSLTNTDPSVAITGGVLNNGIYWIDRIDDNRIIMGYQNSSNQPRLVVADRAGGLTYTFGTPLDISGTLATRTWAGQVYDGGARVLVAGENEPIQVFDISGTTLTPRGTVNLVSAAAGEFRKDIEILGTDGNKMVIGYMGASAILRAVTVDVTDPDSLVLGTAVTAWTPNTGGSGVRLKRISSTDSFVMVAQHPSNTGVQAEVLTVNPSTLAVTQGTPVDFGGSASSIKFDVTMLTATRGAMLRRNAADADLILFDVNVAAKSITPVGTPFTLAVSETESGIYMQASGSNRILVSGENGGTAHAWQVSVFGEVMAEIDEATISATGTVFPWTTLAGADQGNDSFAFFTREQNLIYVKASFQPDDFQQNFAGYAQQTLAATNTGVVAFPGDVSTQHTGLEPGKTYFLDTNANLTTGKTPYKAGVARSATSLIVDFDIEFAAETLQNVRAGSLILNQTTTAAADLTPNVTNNSFIVTSGNGDAITTLDYGAFAPSVGHTAFVRVKAGDSLVHGAGNMKLAGAANFVPGGVDGTIILIYTGSTDGWMQWGTALTF